MPLLEPWLHRWQLTADGPAVETHTSLLLPARQAGQPVMLKVACVEEEARGAEILAWWGGEGAARVLALEGDALLMERATGPRSLVQMATTSREADASALHILCATAANLHQPRPQPPASATTLRRWFAALAPTAQREGGVFRQAHAAAAHLLATPREPAVLHGDLHHENILWDNARGWLAIDPKGVLGEPAYEMGAALRNPITPGTPAAEPVTMARRVDVMVEMLGLDRTRILGWCAAQAVLAAIWSIEEGRGRQERLDHWLAVEACAWQLLGASCRCYGG
ncbi:MAG: phosphotransferase, partial [Thermomicrobiales bacterium]|nr:phosphotransferase [Thermomicrobiales bacterium]